MRARVSRLRASAWKHETARLVGLMTAAILASSCSRVPPGFRTKVKVTGRALVSAKPLPGTALSFNSTERGIHSFEHDHWAFVTTDSTGSYSTHLISGTYNVTINPPPGSGFLGRKELVHVAPNHSRFNFTFEGYRVTGSALTPDGAEIDSGRVGAILLPRWSGEAGSSIQHGRYSLLLPGGRYSLSAATADSWAGFWPLVKESVWISADTTIDFQLNGVPISGQVLGPDGHPFKMASVEAEGVVPGRSPRGIGSIRTMTTSDGRYRLYVPSGSYWLWFRCPHPYYIVPRVIGPVSVSKGTSIDADLSGIEWKGTIRRVDTLEPVQDAIVIARPSIDKDDRAAAIGVDRHGGFRFILERGLSYNLEIADQARREKEVVEGIVAVADTTFDILATPLVTTSRADSTVKLTIQSVAGEKVEGRRMGWPPDWIDVTLLNTDPDTVTLALPGDGSFWGQRTPLMDWNVREPGGERLKRTSILMCGNINPLRAREVFRLAPGEQRTFRIAVPEDYGYQKGSHRYQFQLSYENRPHLEWSGSPLGPHDAEALRILRQSTACKLLSNTLELEVKYP